ncbi:FAD binding domain-containing protein [Kineococcus sp. SYSU DK003]|uniref:FAD binding domain-containing protein n=1 Tax=Kineococcus sp. SYSU DK003 TaxID=3383124 RepID=UPI003D7D5B16
MDLNTVETYAAVTDRAGLQRLHTGDAATAVVAGGTWIFSVPQPHLRTLVDVSSMGWEPYSITEAGLRIAATCPIAVLETMPFPAEWRSRPLLRQCARALLASYKVRTVATVGGNICAALPAGAMTSLTVALDGVGEVWAPDGGVRHLPIADLVTGDNRTDLRPGEVLRAVDLPSRALSATTAFRRVSLARLGRSATLVVGRRDLDGRVVVTVTASTPRPVVLRYDTPPTAGAVAAEVEHVVEDGVGWFDDLHGAPDWRRATTLRFVAEIVEELA